MRRYGHRPSPADVQRKKNALKFYEPHLSDETRRKMEGHKGPKMEQAEQAVTRVADEMPGVTPEEAAHALGRKIAAVMFDDPANTVNMDLALPQGFYKMTSWDLAKEPSRTEYNLQTISSDRIASDPVITRASAWRPITQIKANDGNVVLLWWPYASGKGPCLGHYDDMDVWTVVTWTGEKLEPSFDDLCGAGVLFQSIEPASTVLRFTEPPS